MGETTQNKEKQTEKKIISIVIAVVLVLSIVIITAIVIAVKPRKINLNKYVTVAFTGYNSVGNAYLSFDNEAFHADFDEKIKFTEEAETSGYTDVYNLLGINAAGACLDNIGVTLSQESELSNGMTVSLVWNCDDALIEEMFHCNVVYEPTTYTVEGLEEAEIFDPFENLEITFSGISPDGTVSLNTIDNSGVFEELYFECSPTTGLSNGDTVTVSLNGGIDPISYCTENFGSYPIEIQKEYVVQGLNEYISSLSQLSQEDEDALIEQTIEVFNSEINAYWGEQHTINEIRCLGFCLLTPLEGEIIEGENKNGYMYVVLEIDATIDFEYYRNGYIYSSDREFYYYLKFPVPSINNEGDVIVDLEGYTMPSNDFSFSIAFYNGVMTPGIERYDDFNRIFIFSASDTYNIESTIEN